jgi:hypothetical protein
MMVIMEKESRRIAEVLFMDTFEEYTLTCNIVSKYVSEDKYDIYKVPVGIDMSINTRILLNK